MAEHAMIERVARAIMAEDPMADYGLTASPCDYYPEARAAIAAMREPSDEAVERAYMTKGGPLTAGEVRSCVRSVVDHALEEG